MSRGEYFRFMRDCYQDADSRREGRRAFKAARRNNGRKKVDDGIHILRAFSHYYARRRPISASLAIDDIGQEAANIRGKCRAFYT